MSNIPHSISHVLPDIAGVCGVVLNLWYYFLLQLGKASTQNLSFSIANMVGSTLLLFSLWHHWNLSSAMVETSWLLISLYGVIKNLYPTFRSTSNCSKALLDQS